MNNQSSYTVKNIGKDIPIELGDIFVENGACLQFRPKLLSWEKLKQESFRDYNHAQDILSTKQARRIKFLIDYGFLKVDVILSQRFETVKYYKVIGWEE